MCGSARRIISRCLQVSNNICMLVEDRLKFMKATVKSVPKAGVILGGASYEVGRPLDRCCHL